MPEDEDVDVRWRRESYREHYRPRSARMMRSLAALLCIIAGATYIVPAIAALRAEFAHEPFAPLWVVLWIAGAGLGWWTAALAFLLTGKRHGR